ncbi:hypothetical protein HNP37_003415 [Flavobacterium nitrogenifigens]|uniref:Uncharacterized protein n=2 Tax=Flavobacterium TaxID=237 RepID=A0A7W7J0L5_9FLAO|nr:MULTISPECIES: hypothetical protein [Flavobacterium]MBB4803340.1 hypothetical protein [Flavobacterium nitrogenifigens]MBB6388298.1 hypothetical protein [Flavobacterium notoginsengisoli]
MKQEHKIILELLASYLEENPSQRFGQALFNLSINEFQKTADPRNPNYNIRDIHGDNDLDILERIQNRLDLIESQKNN